MLKTHPGVAMISRDRAPASAEAVHAGAPQAVQVAARWYLLKNMQEVVQRFMTQQHALSAQAATTVIARHLAPPAEARRDTPCDGPHVLQAGPLPGRAT